MTSSDSRPFKKPKGSYTQTRRLVEFYDRLHAGGVLNAVQLSDEWGVNRRTIERDLGLLREVLNSQLEWKESPEPGWRFVGRRPKWSTTRWQVLAIAVGVRMIRFLSGRSFRTHVDPLLSQLRDALPGTQGYSTRELENKIHVVETGHKLYRQDSDLQKRLAVMVDGLLRDRPIELSYCSAHSQHQKTGPKAHRVHVLSLVLHRAAVYFIVDLLDPLSGERRARRPLALDRILNASLDEQAEPLVRPRGFDPKKHLATAFAIWTGEGKHDVTIEIDASYALHVKERHWHDTQHIVDNEAGNLVLSMHLGELTEVAEWVVGMSPHAKVLGPPELRQIVRDRLERALSLHR